ncbi:MAG: hypothetical protein HJJLKODD_02610 [Phycisphaerae bacterium]|nr:hypothetical protein [Phycisphaerae bacterium]
MSRGIGLFVMGIVALLSTEVRADGFLIAPKENRTLGLYSVPFHHVDIKINDQVAKVQVNQAFYNPQSHELEVEYLFPLPEDAAVDSFVMMVDGREMPGKILDRDEARRIYEGIVRSKKDPALLEYMGRGLFKTSVFPLPPGQQRQVTITYSQLCRQEYDVVHLVYPLTTEKFSAQPLQELKITGQITSRQAIKNIYSPSLPVTITRPDENTAQFSYEQRQVLPREDFHLYYGVSADDVGLSLLSYRPSSAEPGYFLLLASPKVKQTDSAVLPKTVLLVLDQSGSMSGQKIEQAKASLRFILDRLRPEDNFNIITYSSEVSVFKEELQAANSASLNEARQYVDRISAGGSTNIDAALQRAMSMLKPGGQPSYVLFLTDGLPTAGEQREAAIAENCQRLNQVHARLMVFGVGDDVNARLLDRLSTDNFGTSVYVRPAEDIEAPVANLYSRISDPVLSDVQLEFSGLDSSLTYPRQLPDLFRGQQLVVVGRYHQSGMMTVKLSGQVGTTRHEYLQTVQMDDRQALTASSFVEKLWAERRVGYLLNEIDLHGQNKELVDEIVRLSTRYGILTPYTSFLADEGIELADAEENGLRLRSELENLGTTSGDAGVGQRASKNGYMQKSAPASAGRQIAVDYLGKERELSTVYNIGTRTYFFKSNRWIDSTVTPEQEKQAVKLVQFSDEYFEVIRQLPASENQYLGLEGELLVNLAGKTYLITVTK